MTFLAAVLGTAGPGAVALMFVILARLTQKWEAVTRTRSYYRLFYASAILVIAASLTRLVRAGSLNSTLEPEFLLHPRSWFYLCFYHVPMVLGITIGLIVAWRNWGWLLGRQQD